jgi:hypothetical protein
MVVQVHFMNPTQRIVSDTGGAVGEVHLLLTAGAVESAHDPERVMAKIWLQATQLGPVLEGILQAPHTESHWEKGV